MNRANLPSDHYDDAEHEPIGLLSDVRFRTVPIDWPIRLPASLHVEPARHRANRWRVAFSQSDPNPFPRFHLLRRAPRK